MASTIARQFPAPIVPTARPTTPLNTFGHGIRLAIITAIALLAVAAALHFGLSTLLSAVGVQESFTRALAGMIVGLLPAFVYLVAGAASRPLRARSFWAALACAWGIALIAYALLIGYEAGTQTGAFNVAPTLGFTVRAVEGGSEVVAVDSAGAAAESGFQTGDVIIALRRDVLTTDQLLTRIAESQPDDVLRLRVLRDGEELALTPSVRVVAQADTAVLVRGLVGALLIAGFGLFFPALWTPYLLLSLSLLPLLLGYLWLIIATFSSQTRGLLPVTPDGAFGGFTLDNWEFLNGQSFAGSTINIWTVTLNSLLIAIAMTVAALVIGSMAGYALSRMNFPGRRLFLSMTLVLHGFPAVTLIIPIFLVLINLGRLPIIGNYIGYNTSGGVALVMVAFELPLAIWLMKGFFDTISWDMERSAMIDGATRWRTFREIILPQIRPGLLALGIFSFISGWNAYLIPATYSVGTGLATLPVYIRQLTGELTPINWNQVAAVGLFQLIPIFVFFIFAQEYLLNIYAGGTKGST